VDGESVGTTSITAPISVLSEISIARLSPEQASDYYAGFLDEIRFWNGLRTADQINGTMNQVLDGDNFGLVNYWRINDGKGRLVTDARGISTGTIIGADSTEIDDMWQKTSL